MYPRRGPEFLVYAVSHYMLILTSALGALFALLMMVPGLVILFGFSQRLTGRFSPTVFLEKFISRVG